MNQGRVERTDRDLVRIDDLVFCIQRDDVKLFLKTISNQAAEVVAAKVNRVATARNLGDGNKIEFSIPEHVVRSRCSLAVSRML